MKLQSKWTPSTRLFPSWKRARLNPWAESQGDILVVKHDEVLQLERWPGHRGRTGEHHLLSRWGFKNTGVFISPAFLTSRARSKAAVKHLFFFFSPWGSYIEPSSRALQWTLHPSEWKEWNPCIESKQQSYTKRMCLLIHDSSQISQAYPWCQISHSWAAFLVLRSLESRAQNVPT